MSGSEPGVICSGVGCRGWSEGIIRYYIPRAHKHTRLFCAAVNGPIGSDSYWRHKQEGDRFDCLHFPEDSAAKSPLAPPKLYEILLGSSRFVVGICNARLKIRYTTSQLSYMVLKASFGILLFPSIQPDVKPLSKKPLQLVESAVSPCFLKHGLWDGVGPKRSARWQMFF